MAILKILNIENSSQEEIDTFLMRRAVRGIVFDHDNNIALIHAKNNNYYELPGGGGEKEETLEEAFIREMKEETGCLVEIVKELGTVSEVRKRSKLVNNSTCFVAKILGDKGETRMTEKEIGECKEVMWVTIEEAENHIRSSDTKRDLYHTYVVERDMAFLSTFRRQN